MRGGLARLRLCGMADRTRPSSGLRATFSLRAKSRLRRLRSDTRLRAQPRRGRQGGLSRQHHPCCENCNFVLLIAKNRAIIPVSVLCIHTCLYIFADIYRINA